MIGNRVKTENVWKGDVTQGDLIHQRQLCTRLLTQ